ncbi:helix-loop-helix DNA-binding domain-containing protein [Colletotrichum higginsianum]|uniref:Helix-loop-helix DNA-binding domain-containing protein n=3 Tax=Colletotrichum destructivum species complex TaxID=2707350 RepID=H1VC70_COLHI|nr:Helix-loop-helix DNA-binding domain-containing protein [Colletotrichum higginsianum IMI 349063]OBR14080.1 Helix-loop-helix DNA-binding domain-containing protein [Colletotrichum higginsianum IMI 349063]TID02761.1 Transcriptional regulator CBF1 [Colletotrichum higginsianum]GJC95259.1 helix-loop-helix DNA-binding domain-containing protein [Colletotrichum higginsianum]CCF37823.1 helix-loop-helix DNA-binding domain-containing protein [Colletotrichum higginsianum]
MTDVMADHPDLSELAGSPSPGQKRKRDDMSESNSPGRAKRASAGLSDADTAAFIENAVEAAHAAAANGVNVADFSALQQAAAAVNSEAADPANASSTAAAALGSMYPTLHVPPTTEEQFAAQTSDEPNHGQDHTFGHADLSPSDGLPALPTIPQPTNGVQSVQPQQTHQTHQQHQQHQQHQPPQPQHRYSSGSAGTPAKKPDVGSEEWHKMRKDNHKEVERRRRETINEGINELAKIVPNCEKNKGSILQRAVTFINQLKENETQNIEKWTLEKLLTEQAIAELSASNDKLKQECERLYKELETWKRVAQNAGLSYPQANKEEPAATT